MNEKHSRSVLRTSVRVALTFLVCAGILAGAAWTVMFIYRTEPTAEKTGATKKTAALVETVTVHRGNYRPKITALGSVEPAQDIVLSPRVGGQVVELDPSFVPGGMVAQGELLLRIDPADFMTTLSMRESDLRQAKAELEIEKGQQMVAKKEFKLLDETIDAANRALVLREPQIESIRARVDAADAAVKQAQLDLDRTKITAPFDAQIIDRTVNIGSQVAAGDELARLVGVDEYWVMATVPLRHLKWLELPENGGNGSPARLRNTTAWEPNVYREGRIARLIGTVDRQTRLARVLITVADPLARKTDAPPLILGTLLDTHIEGRTIENVTKLNRDYLRKDDTVWVLEDGKLDIRDVEIVFRGPQYVYVRDGLSDGDEVVITTLATVAEGLALRRAADEPADASNGGTGP